MTMQELKKIAKTKGLIFRNAKKITIIRAIQRTEGNNECFASLRGKECRLENCFWREDCLACIRENYDEDANVKSNLCHSSLWYEQKSNAFPVAIESSRESF
jgi:hypothetical protein